MAVLILACEQLFGSQTGQKGSGFTKTYGKSLSLLRVFAQHFAHIGERGPLRVLFEKKQAVDISGNSSLHVEGEDGEVHELTFIALPLVAHRGSCEASVDSEEGERASITELGLDTKLVLTIVLCEWVPGRG